jgi:hypothetical protein
METRATVVNGHRRSRVLLAMLVIAGLASAEAVLGRLAVVEPERRLAESLERMGAALSGNDMSTAIKAWHEAYELALRARRWDGLVACGEAALRLAEASTIKEPWPSMKARELFLGALFRARSAGSVEGVLAAATGFARLGDREVVNHGLKLAQTLAGTDAAITERLAELTARVHAVPRGVGAKQ